MWALGLPGLRSRWFVVTTTGRERGGGEDKRRHDSAPGPQPGCAQPEARMQFFSLKRQRRLIGRGVVVARVEGGVVEAHGSSLVKLPAPGRLGELWTSSPELPIPPLRVGIPRMWQAGFGQRAGGGASTEGRTWLVPVARTEVGCARRTNGLQ